MPLVLSHAEELSLSSVLGTFSLKGLYVLGYGWLFGMCKYRRHR